MIRHLASTGLRERKREQTRVAIQEAARRLAMERGIHAVTVEEIAAAANVSKRTFSNYFDSKENAVIDPAPGAEGRIVAVLAARPDSEAPLVAVRSALIAMLPAHAEQMRLIARLATTSPVLLQRYLTTLEVIERGVARWVSERTGTDRATSAYPDLVAATVSTCMRLVLRRWDPEHGFDRFIEHVTEVFDLLASGLAEPCHGQAGRLATGQAGRLATGQAGRQAGRHD